MSGIEIVVADQALYDRASETIARSFARDPMLRWMIPDENDYRATIPEIFASFAQAAFEHRTAYATTDGSGVALWLSPGVDSDSERMSAALQKVVDPKLRPEVSEVYRRMGSHQPEPGTYWNLPMIGVDPEVSGSGTGSALMQFALEICDKSNHPAFLDSSNPRNVTFYQRHGFEILSEVQYESSPIIRPMLRHPPKG